MQELQESITEMNKVAKNVGRDCKNMYMVTERALTASKQVEHNAIRQRLLKKLAARKAK